MRPKVIEIKVKRGYEGGYCSHKLAMATTQWMTITEEQAEDIAAIRVCHSKMLDHNINMKFIVVPNGTFLPVPASHYQ